MKNLLSLEENVSRNILNKKKSLNNKLIFFLYQIYHFSKHTFRWHAQKAHFYFH